MRGLRILFFLFGLVLLGVILAHTDLAEAGRLTLRIGWGMAVVLGLYFAAFAVDSLSWQITLAAVPLDARWLVRMWQVRMIGEAFNATLPAGGMGGEPVKAMLLNKHYGIGYRDSTASLVLAKTVNMIGLVLFLAGGFALMLGNEALAGSYKAVAGAGLGSLALAILAFFLIQRYAVSSAVAGWVGRWRGGRRLAGALAHIHEIESRFARFYGKRQRRFLAAVLLALVNWMLGTLEVYYTLAFLGQPIAFTDAWVIEAVAQLVRTATFFIPASIGAQEGAFVLLCAAITGSPTVGVAVALVRRLREILWIAGGFALGPLLARRARAAVDGGA